MKSTIKLTKTHNCQNRRENRTTDQTNPNLLKTVFGDRMAEWLQKGQTWFKIWLCQCLAVWLGRFVSSLGDSVSSPVKWRSQEDSPSRGCCELNELDCEWAMLGTWQEHERLKENVSDDYPVAQLVCVCLALGQIALYHSPSFYSVEKGYLDQKTEKSLMCRPVFLKQPLRSFSQRHTAWQSYLA